MLCSDPFSAFAPGGAANAAFVFRCNCHKAANIKQDRCFHPKMNQWPQGTWWPPFFFFFFFLISSDASAPPAPPGGQLAEQDQREPQLDADFMMTQRLSNKK